VVGLNDCGLCCRGWLDISRIMPVSERSLDLHSKNINNDICGSTIMKNSVKNINLRTPVSHCSQKKRKTIGP
jgi:hypothetical protein